MNRDKIQNKWKQIKLAVVDLCVWLVEGSRAGMDGSPNAYSQRIPIITEEEARKRFEEWQQQSHKARY